MGKFVTVCSLALPLLLLPPEVMGAENWRAIDGDTVKAPWGEVIRLKGIDTAELHCRCAYECHIAQEALGFVVVSLRGARAVTLARDGQDRYGRTLGYLGLDGKDLGSLLMERGLARVWTGRRLPWCQ